MFIGHFGTSFAAKKVAPQPSLGTLFFAAQFIDLLWPLLLLFGLEAVEIDPGNTAVTPLDFIYYPFSHSMVGVLFWALLFGGIYFYLKRNLKNSLWLGSLVFSHWLLDLFTHRPDLPLYPGSETMVGMGLWNSVIGTLILELFIFGGGVYLYAKITRPKNKQGRFSLWSLVIFLVGIYLMNILGPPPPDTEPIAYLGLAQWLLIAWGYWIDRNRSVKDRIKD
jgi:hypothetical protein